MITSDRNRMRRAWCLMMIAPWLSVWITLPVSAEEALPLPKPLAAVKHPNHNPPSPEKIALGRQLFFDPRLSRTETISCASCHDPAKGFSNGKRFGIGVDDTRGTRHAPTLFNVAYNQSFFWDGRAKTLEEQALEPIQNKREMDMPLEDLVAKLSGAPEYRRRFRSVFDDEISAESVAQAIAAFERTIISKETPFDQFLAGEESALSANAKRGMALFYGQARCSVCHQGANFTDQKFHNVGVVDEENPDTGRHRVTGRESDWGAFKTPTLREVAHTAPYMHDGRFQTLDEVVWHYNFGGVTDAENPNRDEALEVLYLSDEQVAELIAFLAEGLSTRPLSKEKMENSTERK